MDDILLDSVFMCFKLIWIKCMESIKTIYVKLQVCQVSGHL